MSDFDISSIEIADTFKVDILHPKTGDQLYSGGAVVRDEDSGEEKNVGGQPITVTVYGPGSKQFKAAQAANNKRLGKSIRRGRIEEDADEAAERTASFLAACTISFDNFVYKNMENGPQAFRACYRDPKMGWFTDQVNDAMGDWANFTKSDASN